jgi:phage gp45-like
MNKLALFGQLSKTLGYLAFGLNNVLRFVGTATSKVGNVVSNKQRYDIEVLVDGATTITHKNQTEIQLRDCLEGMDRFGVTEVIIKQHITEQQKEKDNDN